MKNYKLTDNTIVHNGITLYQIEAINDLKGVKKGTLGGYIESTDNLADNAIICDNARVFGDAIATKDVFNINSVYNLTVTDNHIMYGCIQRTIKEWKEFLDSDEVIQTPRDTDKFKHIKNTLEFVINKHEIDNQNNK